MQQTIPLKLIGMWLLWCKYILVICKGSGLSQAAELASNVARTFKVHKDNNPRTLERTVRRVSTVCEVMNTMPVGKQMFTEVAKLLRVFLTIPVTTSTAERSFSALRRLKTYLKSTMTQVRLNNIMILHLHKARTDEINLLRIAE